MKTFFENMRTWLSRTWVWSLLLVLSLAMLVWFVGPLLAVDDYKFWASATSRSLSISGLFLLWGLGLVFSDWRASVRKQLAKTLEDSEARRNSRAEIETQRRELTRRFKQALRTLKTSSLYRGRSERWRSDLPWYMLIGPKASGKTSLLALSGLEFPLNTIDRKARRTAVSTQHCDWYFADQGVLIDTCGRYLEQSQVAVDAGAWFSLLRLLRNRRRSRPLNGVLVTVPVNALLSAGKDDFMAIVQQVRSRLHEIRQQLHVDFPVYLVLTKADQLPGFEAFFHHLTHEESQQVLGSTLRENQDGTDTGVLREEFEALLHRLNNQVIPRMHLERDIEQRGLILDFPNQLGPLGDGLCEFVQKTFHGNRYQQAIPLRGFYLTSAAPAPTQASAPIKQQARIDLPAVASTGQPRFIHHVFSKVIFPEADLAGLDKRERRRIHWGQRAVYGIALTALAGLGLLWSSGFSANHERFEQVRELARQWAAQDSHALAANEPETLLKALDLRFAATQVFPSDEHVSAFERTGLYQGDASNPSLTAAYERELEGRLLPWLATQLEGQVRGSLKDRERLLNNLRAYLMLNVTGRRDAAWLKQWLASEWSVRHAGNTALQEGLNAHLERLLARPFSYPLNDTLVGQARHVLRGESLANVVYRVLREQARSMPDYRLSQHLGSQGGLFVGADHVIPGFYTQQGYQQYFVLHGSHLVTDILRDNWVLGEGSDISAMDLRRLLVELEQRYFRDYANYWGDAVGRVALRPSNDAGEAAELLAGLISANSPVLQLLQEVRENTRFALVAEIQGSVPARAENSGDKAGALGKLATAAAGQAQGALAKALPDTAKQALQRRFEPLHRLLDSNNGPAGDLTPALNALNDVQLQLASVARASAPEQAAFDMAKARMSGQRDALSSLRNASGRLPRPVSAWFSVLAEDSWRLVLDDTYRYLNQRYQSELYSFYRKAVHKRYPFDAHSASDVALTDFREFFKAQGIAERFFETYMRPFVSGDPGRYRLRSIDGRSLPASSTYLDQMAALQVIRQSFFAQNPNEPEVQFKLEPYTLDPSVSRAEFRFGNQVVEYRHGPIVPTAFIWPTDAQGGRSSLVLERAVGRPIGIEKNTGPWSLFRLFDLMQTEYLSGRDVVVLKADVGGLRANYLLMSQRTPNPFDMSVLRTFRMPVQL
uniref:type VI secretion system membrane subunit TssM n=1 Tax=Pseudomonas laurentiana TaxID=2364649 RepID=UPI0029C7DC79|nr:type VI secretion system membrane subunit TssM [Pseudomonas laurentiana]